jgi:hypothetical protein
MTVGDLSNDVRLGDHPDHNSVGITHDYKTYVRAG